MVTLCFKWISTPNELMASLAKWKQLYYAWSHVSISANVAEQRVCQTHDNQHSSGIVRMQHLLFGIASSPAVFQHAMHSIPLVVCYLDDILITARKVWSPAPSTSGRGVETIAREWSGFASEQVPIFPAISGVLTGHHIDAEGVYTSDTKVKAIVKTPAPIGIYLNYVPFLD